MSRILHLFEIEVADVGRAGSGCLFIFIGGVQTRPEVHLPQVYEQQSTEETCGNCLHRDGKRCTLRGFQVRTKDPGCPQWEPKIGTAETNGKGLGG
jgi:hypothetical protein